jgi:hypothetical protein
MCKSNVWSKGMSLTINDELFVAALKEYLMNKRNSLDIYKDIPENLICINRAKMFFYKFPIPMFNESQLKTFPNSEPRLIPSINVLGIAKNIINEQTEYYEGWEPQQRGKKIMDAFFTQHP